MASNSKKNTKKAVVDYSAKREKKIKEALLLDVATHFIDDNELVDGEFEYLKIIKRFGKKYYQVKNNVTSL